MWKLLLEDTTGKHRIQLFQVGKGGYAVIVHEVGSDDFSCHEYDSFDDAKAAFITQGRS